MDSARLGAALIFGRRPRAPPLVHWHGDAYCAPSQRPFCSPKKAQALNVPINSVFLTLQAYLGSSYVNDFNFLGRVYQVNAQGQPQFRDSVGNIRQLYTRNNSGGMVPLGTLLSAREIVGPDKVMHYNLYPSADISGTTLPGVSSGQAIQIMDKVCRETLPPQFGFEWTELSLQQVLAGNSAVYIFPLCVLLVFLVLAALYESWALPVSIILIVPMCLLAAITGVFIRQMDNDIFTQIGFVVLVGLACKNAILIIEFAKDEMDRGKDRLTAATEAARLRLRPILMTSFAFTFGVLPLVIATGRGDAPGSRNGGLQRYDRRHVVRHFSDPGLLLGDYEILRAQAVQPAVPNKAPRCAKRTADGGLAHRTIRMEPAWLYQNSQWQVVDAIYSVSEFGLKLWNWESPRRFVVVRERLHQTD
jgi:AcrB/AcrD/AcrF family